MAPEAQEGRALGDGGVEPFGAGLAQDEAEPGFALRRPPEEVRSHGLHAFQGHGEPWWDRDAEDFLEARQEGGHRDSGEFAAFLVGQEGWPTHHLEGDLAEEAFDPVPGPSMNDSLQVTPLLHALDPEETVGFILSDHHVRGRQDGGRHIRRDRSVNVPRFYPG